MTIYTFYKIVCNDDKVTETYVGSTKNLNDRISKHKYRCNTPDVEGYNLKVYQFIRANGGWFNWKFVILETKECIDKYDAHQIEQQYIDDLKCELNNQSAYTGITYYENVIDYKHQYYEINKERLLENHKEYYVINKERLLEHNKEYRQLNIEKIKEKDKEYYAKNKQHITEYKHQYRQLNIEKIKEKDKKYYLNNTEKIKEKSNQWYKNNKEKVKQIHSQKHTCVCGIEYTYGNKSRHEQTQRHLSKVE